jgi:hypothetical protein
LPRATGLGGACHDTVVCVCVCVCGCVRAIARVFVCICERARMRAPVVSPHGEACEACTPCRACKPCKTCTPCAPCAPCKRCKTCRSVVQTVQNVQNARALVGSPLALPSQCRSHPLAPSFAPPLFSLGSALTVPQPSPRPFLRSSPFLPFIPLLPSPASPPSFPFILFSPPPLRSAPDPAGTRNAVDSEPFGRAKGRLPAPARRQRRRSVSASGRRPCRRRRLGVGPSPGSPTTDCPSPDEGSARPGPARLLRPSLSGQPCRTLTDSRRRTVLFRRAVSRRARARPGLSIVGQSDASRFSLSGGPTLDLSESGGLASIVGWFFSYRRIVFLLLSSDGVPPSIVGWFFSYRRIVFLLLSSDGVPPSIVGWFFSFYRWIVFLLLSWDNFSPLSSDCLPSIVRLFSFYRRVAFLLSSTSP